MTYSLLHFDKKDKKIISAVCSNWTGIQLCRVAGKAGVVHTQSWADYTIAHDILDSFDQGIPPDKAIESALINDPHVHIRQLLVCDFEGRTGVFSGDKCTDEYWSICEENTVIAGNMLSSKRVIEDLFSEIKHSSESRPEMAIFNAMKSVHENAEGYADKRGDRSLSIKSIPSDYRKVDEYQLDLTIDSAIMGERVYEKFGSCINEHFNRDNKILK